MTEIKLFRSPWLAIKLVLGSLLFVVAGIGMIISSIDPVWAGYLCVLFFGLGVVLGAYLLLDKNPEITINEIGILSRTTSNTVINWEVIRDAYPMQIYSQKFICLIVDEEWRPSKTKGKWFKATAKLNELIGAQELNISLGQLKIDEYKLTQFILMMCSVPTEERISLLSAASLDLKT